MRALRGSVRAPLEVVLFACFATSSGPVGAVVSLSHERDPFTCTCDVVFSLSRLVAVIQLCHQAGDFVRQDRGSSQAPSLV